MRIIVDDIQKKEWRAHWPVVVAAMAGLAASHVHFYSMGVMVTSLEKEFGWSRTQITSGLFIIAMIGFPLSPLVGTAVDRFGSRRIALFGMSIYSLAVVSLSFAQQSYVVWWLLWAFVAIGYLLLSPTIWVTAISRLFDASRGVAIAVTLSANGLISFGAPLLTLLLVQNFGWRAAYAILGVLAGAIAFPLLYFFFSSGRDGDAVRRTSAVVPRTYARAGFRFPKDVNVGAFVRLAFAASVMAMVFTAVVVNLVPILTSSGLTVVSAAAVAGIVGAMQVTGRLAGGFLLDRFNARYVGALVVLFPIASSLIFIGFHGSAILCGVGVLLFGLAAGAELDAVSYLASRYFPAGNFGAVFGFVIGLALLGSGLGPIVASFIYDVTGSYRLMLWAVVPLCALSSLAFLTLGPYLRADERASV
ncbi:MFS transporter [Sphingobium subterraneum]|uniref:MFS family permease n=1 Tax=Sphingobium subterraneum TaxID=627688 RepID=A0A841IXJ5_9SPHN|nr:MFS transporter [Sphingobium subterraneum]MBB6123383.1 MFS family permease [Sphingobium subterraneum]